LIVELEELTFDLNGNEKRELQERVDGLLMGNL
jgi:hypothetical protein